MAPVKPSPWAAKRAGTLNKFYTRAEVGELLTAELGDIVPQSMVDLGAGEGSLSVAAVRRWPNVNVTTVDIDDTCAESLHQRMLDQGIAEHQHYALDVLDSELPTRVGTVDYDLAVCNPPFFRPKWDRAFARILQAADFSSACASVADCTAEILFFAQSLRLVRQGGAIAFIVPDGLATGWRAVNFRKALLEHHTLRAVIQLPPYSFVDTEAYCFILIVTKGKRDAKKPIKLIRLNEDGTISNPLWIDSLAAEARLDWGFHSAKTDTLDRTFTLRELGAEIRRGSLSTVERRAVGFPVFHTGDFPLRGGLVNLADEVGSLAGRKLVVAEVGDILMARVDRELHEKIALVACGKAAITDCLYRIRLPKACQESVFKAMTSEEARDRILAVTKGVGARLLGKGELLDLPFSRVAMPS